MTESRIRLCCFADEISKSLPEQIRVMKKHGIDLVEMRSAEGINVLDFEEDFAARTAETLKEAGISVWALGSPLGKSSISEDISLFGKRLEKLLRTAEIMGTDKIRVFSFYDAYDDAGEVVSRLKYAVSHAAERGITLCHENEKEIFGDTAERVKFLSDNVPGLRFVFDPANFVQCGEDIGACLGTLGNLISYYHVKDIIRETGEIVPAGEGDARTELPVRVAESFSSRGGNGETVFTIEPHLSMFDGYSAIDRNEMKNKYVFSSGEEAFDAAEEAFEKVLIAEGYAKDTGETIWKK